MVAVAAFFMLVLGLLVASASAQTILATNPKFVADSPSTGAWIPVWNTAGTDTTKGVLLLEVKAETETKFTAWWWRSSKLPHKVKWALYGPAATDTTYTIPAGETRTYTFPKPGVQYLVIKSGDALFSGE